MSNIKLPEAPSSIQKGVPLKLVLDIKAVKQLAHNLGEVRPSFDKSNFIKASMKGIEPLGLKDRASHLSKVMHDFLPSTYAEAVEIILASLTPPLIQTQDNGLAPMFYMPHCNFVADYGVDSFDVSMKAQYELTKRFTCEFSIRTFLEHEQNKTLNVLFKWMNDPDPHVRRLCSEGTRPRLPWASKLDAFAKDPELALPILEGLKNDPDLYVRRSVANHVGDIAKDHLDFAMDLCHGWLKDASPELKWVIRHAVRNPFKKGNKKAASLRKAAK